MTSRSSKNARVKIRVSYYDEEADAYPLWWSICPHCERRIWLKGDNYKECESCRAFMHYWPCQAYNHTCPDCKYGDD